MAIRAETPGRGRYTSQGFYGDTGFSGIGMPPAKSETPGISSSPGGFGGITPGLFNDTEFGIDNQGPGQSPV